MIKTRRKKLDKSLNALEVIELADLETKTFAQLQVINGAFSYKLS